jgi:hypothetical protein
MTLVMMMMMKKDAKMFRLGLLRHLCFTSTKLMELALPRQRSVHVTGKPMF